LAREIFLKTLRENAGEPPDLRAVKKFPRSLFLQS